MGAAAERAVRSGTAPAPAGPPTGSVIGRLPPGHDLPTTGWLRLGPVPADWSLVRVARSHGWADLAPNAYDPTSGVFYRTLALPDAGPLTVRVEPTGRVTWGRTRGTDADRAAARQALRRVLCCDDSVAELDRALRAVPTFARLAGQGGGRLLRSPTVWEDLARMLATTNCSWSLTRSMVSRLVDGLGSRGETGEVAFPEPAAVLAAGAGFLRTEVRAGYRAESFTALAAQADSAEAWLHPGVDTQTVAGALLGLRGFGPYAAQGMLGLLGRPRGLAIDSWVRAKLPRLVGADSLTDAQIADRYRPLGPWAGWGLWLEMTADWFVPARPD